jgi:hypothetical protein
MRIVSASPEDMQKPTRRKKPMSRNVAVDEVEESHYSLMGSSPR